MHTQSLDGDRWTVQAVGDLSHVPEHIRGKIFPARVPGCVHLDLIRAGVLRHPNEGYAERDQEWIGRTDWRYELEFTPGEFTEEPTTLVFEGVDTAAGVELNGRALGRVQNAFTAHRFNVRGLILRGENSIAVTIAAPITLVEREHVAHHQLPHNGDELGWHPFNMLRKPACNFGWDWGPRVATSGVSGPVSLRRDTRLTERFEPPCTVALERGRWRVHADAVADRDVVEAELLDLSLSLNGSVVAAELRDERSHSYTELWLDVEQPQLWWPRGFGPQPVYELRLHMRLGDEEIHQSWPIGFRSVELDTSPDRIGSAFALRVNGEPVFCRGANWIPDTLFSAEASPERIRERVRQAAEANMNMLRVWGGGFYEQEAFYRACDDFGVMVWQDFMFACALYPEREFFRDVGRELEHQTGRLASHPSIVLWCGGNECVEGFQHWGWKERIGADTAWGRQTYCDLLPSLLRSRDATRPYWPNSPWSDKEGWDDTLAGDGWVRDISDVRDPDHGDRHTWDLQFDDVRQIVPRFVSEFGRVAPACERTLWEAGVFEEAEGIESWPRRNVAMAPGVKEALEHRIRQTGGSGVAYDPVLPEHFREVATDLRGWLWQTQALQARALKTHIEWLRANSPRCMGALIWQHNDCWACQSWSLIDYAGRPKPSWYQVRRSFAPRLLTIQPMDGGERLSAALVNDTAEAFEGECVVRRVTLAGDELARSNAPLSAGPRSVGRIDALTDLVGRPDDPTSEVLVAESGGLRDVWCWNRDRELRLEPDALGAEIVERDGDVAVRLEARSLARDVIIAADLLGEHARAAESCFTMLAGESREIAIDNAEPELVRAVAIEDVVRWATG